MTVIAALRHDNQMYMAGDRLVSGDNLSVNISRPKVWQRDQYLFGFAGTLDAEHIAAKFVPPTVSGSLDTFMQTTFLEALDDFYTSWSIIKDPKGGTGLSLLICVGNYIYEHDPAYLTMTRYSLPYMAIGSGSAYALGSLYSTNGQDPTNRLKLAIGSACKFSPECGQPIDIISMTVPNKTKQRMEQ